MDDPYPDFDGEPQGKPDELAHLLKEWDAPHFEKAAVLVQLARTEFRMAHANDAEIPTDFAEFADDVDTITTAIIDDMDDPTEEDDE